MNDWERDRERERIIFILYAPFAILLAAFRIESKRTNEQQKSRGKRRTMLGKIPAKVVSFAFIDQFILLQCIERLRQRRRSGCTKCIYKNKNRENKNKTIHKYHIILQIFYTIPVMETVRRMTNAMNANMHGFKSRRKRSSWTEASEHAMCEQSDASRDAFLVSTLDRLMFEFDAGWCLTLNDDDSNAEKTLKCNHKIQFDDNAGCDDSPSFAPVHGLKWERIHWS